MSEVVHHVNRQNQKIFYPDENTDPVDRFWACVEIGGGSVLFAAAGVEAVAGTLTTAATAGGATTIGTTSSAAATAACADGDCTNEATMALDAGTKALELMSADGDPGNEIETISRSVADVAGNTPFRPSQGMVDASYVERYARQMSGGSFNWDAMRDKIQIIRASDGMFIAQGHHRVLAAQLAGVEIPESAITYIDVAGNWVPMVSGWGEVVWSGF